MKKHVMALTYQPKIPAVFDGKCTQTIRKGRRVAVGDEILFHTWTGAPRRSPWGERLRVVVSETMNIIVDYSRGILVPEIECNWEHWVMDLLAELDYIDPPTGIELRNVLFGLNHGEKTFEAQIIRWSI